MSARAPSSLTSPSHTGRPPAARPAADGCTTITFAWSHTSRHSDARTRAASPHGTAQPGDLPRVVDTRHLAGVTTAAAAADRYPAGGAAADGAARRELLEIIRPMIRKAGWLARR
ncbi:hypothetical protein GCM10020000_64270 [Streptomyces olivoverticillatus]